MLKEQDRGEEHLSMVRLPGGRLLPNLKTFATWFVTSEWLVLKLSAAGNKPWLPLHSNVHRCPLLASLSELQQWLHVAILLLCCCTAIPIAVVANYSNLADSHGWPLPCPVLSRV